MEAGCDPCIKNKKSQTPYVVSANKETRNVFRRFLADFPDKYDYSKVQIMTIHIMDSVLSSLNNRSKFKYINIWFCL
jgi:hypothetical protein